jgi:hypothetical protein
MERPNRDARELGHFHFNRSNDVRKPRLDLILKEIVHLAPMLRMAPRFWDLFPRNHPEEVQDLSAVFTMNPNTKLTPRKSARTQHLPGSKPLSTEVSIASIWPYHDLW